MSAPDVPVLRLVRGDATPEELAVITALFAAGRGDPQPDTKAPRGRWNDPARSVRRHWPHGEGGWRSAR
jgi:hypothetical protein